MDLSNLIDEMIHYERKSRKFHEIMEGDPEVRKNYVGFGMETAITCGVIGGLSLISTIVNIVLLVTAVSPVGGLIWGMFAALLGLSFAFSTLRYIPYVKWQRKLNDNKIWVAALVIMILNAVFAVAMSVTGGWLFVSGINSCAA